MQRYVFREGRFRDPKTGKPMPLPKRSGIAMPFVVGDIEDYQSPIDGKRVSGRAGQKEDLKRHGCRLLDRSEGPKGFQNREFCKQRGLSVNEEMAHAFEAKLAQHRKRA